jgi:S-adenosylmethionine:diacylglycerol 3-amino-3-carboxypropyl transferase
MAHTATADDLKRAVHHHPAHSGAGALERLFTFAFSGLVYPQIWEDPEVDMAAMELGPDHRVITIASGGCNVLSYLARRPQSILAVDLNPAHVALTRLKLAAARHLPSDVFHRFFADAGSLANPAIYDAFLRPHLDEETRRYWDSPTLPAAAASGSSPATSIDTACSGASSAAPICLPGSMARTPRRCFRRPPSRSSGPATSATLHRSSRRNWCAG